MTYKAKFKGPTNSRGSRIIVTDWSGKRSEHPWKHELSTEKNYLYAAKFRAASDGYLEPFAVMLNTGSAWVFGHDNYLDFI
jgi:hypothetical protein